MQAQNKTDVSARVYGLAYTAAQLVAWLLTIAAIWRFIVGDFRHPISLLGMLIDHLGMQRASGYWMDAPPSWDQGDFVLLQWPAYYATGLALYALAGHIVMGVLCALDWLMTLGQKKD